MSTRFTALHVVVFLLLLLQECTCKPVLTKRIPGTGCKFYNGNSLHFLYMSKSSLYLGVAVQIVSEIKITAGGLIVGTHYSSSMTN